MLTIFMYYPGLMLYVTSMVVFNSHITLRCPRFTLHLYREKLQHEKGEKKMGWSEDQLDYYLPQRPLSCRSETKDENLVKLIIYWF